MNKFYPLVNAEWTKVRKTLKPVEIVILYHLRTLQPFGDRPIKINVTELARELEINRSTASRALKQLEQKGFLKYQLEQISVVLSDQKVTGVIKSDEIRCDQKIAGVIKKAQSEEIGCDQKVTPNDQKVTPMDQKVTPNDQKVTVAPFKGNLGEDFGASHTINTINTDQIRSEIENFVLKDREIDEVETDQKKTEIAEIVNPIFDEKLKQKIAIADPVKKEPEKPKIAIAEIKAANPEVKEIDSEEKFKDFIIRTIETERRIKISNRDAYLNKVLEKDANLWRSRYAESQKPNEPKKETVLDAWRIEGALVSAMMMRDYDYVSKKLRNLPHIAEEILGRHPDWRQFVCV